MKTIYLLIISILLICIRTTNAQTWEWTHPEKNSDPPANAQAHDVEVDALGNVYVLGDFNDSLFLNGNFITKGYGSYLAKYDSTGILLWHKLIQCTDTTPNHNPIYASDLAVNGTGIYITGKYIPGIPTDCYDDNIYTFKIGDFSFGDAVGDAGLFITKFNSNGKVIWNKTAKDPFYCDGSTGWQSSAWSPFITSDRSNNIICAFIYKSLRTSLQVGGAVIPLRPGENLAINPLYLVVAKFNSTGSLQWSNYAGGGFAAGTADGNGYVNSTSISLTADKNNNIFISGNNTKDSTYFGSQLYHTSTPPPCCGAYAQSTFIAKISSSGIWQFAKELINSTNDFQINPDQLCVDDQNNVYALANNYWLPPKPIIILGDTAVAVLTNNSLGQYLVKIKNNGSLVWHKGFDGTSVLYTHANSIVYTNNSLYITGNAFGGTNTTVFGSLTVPRHPLTGGIEYFVAKANTNGDFQWVATAGSTGAANLPDFTGMEGLAITAFNNNIYTAGYYIGGITTLGNLNGNYSGPYNSSTSNIFLGKLKDQYVRVGAVTPTALCPGSNLTIPFTSTGLTFTPGNTFTAELSNVNGDFTTPTVIGSTSSTGSGSIIGTIPTNFSYGSGYRIRIRSSDTLKTGYNYYAYADTPYKITLLCPAPSSGFTATNVTSASATLNWNTVGCAKGYKVQYRVKGTKSWTTIQVTSNIGTVNITGLLSNTTYQYRISTKCKPDVVVYSAYSANKQFTTAISFNVSNAIADGDVKTGNSSISVYPNPATNTAVIQISSSKTSNYTVELTDVTGKVLQTKRGKLSPGENKVVIDVTKYVPGMYMVNIIDNERKRTLKLNKE